MARIDYYKIEEELKDILDSDTDVGGSGVKVEIEAELSMVSSDIVLIEMDRRDAPDEMQRVSAGKRTDYILSMAIWCFGYSLDRHAAMRRRDDLMGKVELALMKNRDVGGLVVQSWLRGGEFQNRRNSEGAGFLSGGEVLLEMHVTAQNT